MAATTTVVYQTSEPSPVDDDAAAIWVDTTSNPYEWSLKLKNSSGTWEYVLIGEGRTV